MFEPPGVQQSIVEMLRTDRSVRVALVQFPYWADRIDGIPNEVRAPMVRDELVRDFEVSYARGGVVLLRRKAIAR